MIDFFDDLDEVLPVKACSPEYVPSFVDRRKIKTLVLSEALQHSLSSAHCILLRRRRAGHNLLRKQFIAVIN
jgi:hypothetical protein